MPCFSIRDVIMCAPRMDVQIAIICVQALFWYSFIPWFGRRVIMPFVDTRQWRERWISRSQISLKTNFLIDLNRDAAYDFACCFMGIMVQHLIGAALCIPAILPGLGMARDLAVALACHGALCEVGWELQDTITRAYDVIFVPGWRAKSPPALLAVMGAHHVMGICLAMPMNLHHRDLPMYHEAILSLQGAAFVAFSAKAYGNTLDVSHSSELAQMRACTLVDAAVMIWTRGLRFAWLAVHILSEFRTQGQATMFYGGCAAAALMGMFNLLVIVDSVSKFAKFFALRSSGASEAAVAEGRDSDSYPSQVSPDSSFSTESSDEAGGNEEGGETSNDGRSLASIIRNRRKDTSLAGA